MENKELYGRDRIPWEYWEEKEMCPGELAAKRKRDSLDKFLEKELKGFRETIEKNSNLIQGVEFKRELIDLINRFLEEAHREKKISDGTYDLVRGCLVMPCINTVGEEYACFRERANGSVRIYNPQGVFTRLNHPFFDKNSLIKISLEELSFDKGLSKEAKNFVANVYKIIYDALERNC